MNPPDPNDAIEQIALADRLRAENPALPELSALVMAGDALSAKRAERMVRDGTVTYDHALNLTGSYGRLDLALKLQEEGFASRDHLLDILPGLWPGCDPDDTAERFFVLWREAWNRNGRVTITDGRPLPKPGAGAASTRYLPVYRGQSARDMVGFAWTLDPKVAAKFAAGAGQRAPGIVDPIILSARVARRSVMAYLTKRNESEVILNPAELQIRRG